jgi:hypothetical protein
LGKISVPKPKSEGKGRILTRSFEERPTASTESRFFDEMHPRVKDPTKTTAQQRDAAGYDGTKSAPSSVDLPTTRPAGRGENYTSTRLKGQYEDKMAANRNARAESRQRVVGAKLAAEKRIRTNQRNRVKISDLGLDELFGKGKRASGGVGKRVSGALNAASGLLSVSPEDYGIRSSVMDAKIMSTNPAGAGAKASTLGGRSWMWNIGRTIK